MFWSAFGSSDIRVKLLHEICHIYRKNIEYYNEITRKDLIIDGANDDIGASEIVVNHYKDKLIICFATNMLYAKKKTVQP